VNIIYEILCEILTRLKDIQARAARTETRLMKLADELQVNLRRKE
jgi:hypothetical protein